jgi:hypothetical protein
MKKIYALLLFHLPVMAACAAQLFIPMDETQKNHLKAYGAVYHSIAKDDPVTLLLNYHGGSYMLNATSDMEQYLTSRGISYKNISDAESDAVLSDIKSDPMMGIVKLEVMPKIAVYGSKDEGELDDAVVNVLRYAEIPYDLVYDPEVLSIDLNKYNWIHMHHEDFTGQHGKFETQYGNAAWYKKSVASDEKIAHDYGYASVQSLKLDVAKKLKEYVKNGGHLFGMCSATDSYDIALAMEGVSLDDVYNKNISDLDIKHKLNYDNTFAFTNFMLKRDRKEYEFSDIDTYETRYMQVCERNDKFKLQTIPASERDLCMITQDHVRSIKGFWGMTCGFQIQFIKPDAHILATTDNTSEARYLYGNFGKGSWTFFAGHDPEQYQHHMEDAASDLSLTPNSPGYRLILDNVFLSAVKRENTQSVSMNNVNIFPNPVVTNGMLMINAGMAQASQVRIRLYSLSGQLLVDRSMDANAGENELKFDMSGIASGLYQLEFTAGTEKKNFKVVVQ